MKITPEIKTKIEHLATIIDYGMYSVESLACIKHFEEELDEYDRFEGEPLIRGQVLALGCQAYFIIYRDILNYTEKKLEALTSNHFEMIDDVMKGLRLGSDDVVYSREYLVLCITQYLEAMIWDEPFGAWHPEWK